LAFDHDSTSVTAINTINTRKDFVQHSYVSTALNKQITLLPIRKEHKRQKDYAQFGKLPF
jgi:hypothetical protein